MGNLRIDAAADPQGSAAHALVRPISHHLPGFRAVLQFTGGGTALDGFANPLQECQRQGPGLAGQDRVTLIGAEDSSACQGSEVNDLGDQVGLVKAVDFFPLSLPSPRPAEMPFARGRGRPDRHG